MTTSKQNKANKLNAQKWWVKTSEWKLVSKYNAVKHWLYAKTFFSEQDEQQFKGILSIFVAELQPVWTIENMLLERVVMCQIKLLKLAEFTSEIEEMNKIQAEICYTTSKLPIEQLPDLNDIKPGRQEEYESLSSYVSYLRNKLSANYMNPTYWYGYELTDRLQKFDTVLENKLLRLIKEFYKFQNIRLWNKMGSFR